MPLRPPPPARAGVHSMTLSQCRQWNSPSSLMGAFLEVKSSLEPPQRRGFARLAGFSPSDLARRPQAPHLGLEAQGRLAVRRDGVPDALHLPLRDILHKYLGVAPINLPKS